MRRAVRDRPLRRGDAGGRSQMAVCFHAVRERARTAVHDGRSPSLARDRSSAYRTPNTEHRTPNTEH
ncbi:conserved hypothetical protein [Burkholderia pseudomallei 576]|nr:conserved hypothetical protein [Burkholderia pseudomallei 576]